MKTIITEVKKKKNTWHIIHDLYDEKSLMKILIQNSSTEQRLFMLLPTLISTIVLTETFFDTRNSLKVKSSFAKVNFLLKTNTLDLSTTEKVTNIIDNLTLIKIKILALDKLLYFYN